MPARGDGLAILKWVTSFPRNVERGLPAVAGALLVSERRDGRAAGDPRLRRGDLAAHRCRRRGLGAGARARGRARRSGSIGCGVNGAWAARCLAAAGYGPGVCFDPRRRGGGCAGGRARLGGRGARGGALAGRGRLRHPGGRAGRSSPPTCAPGQHLAALGADAAGKAEVELEALRAAACSATTGSRRRRAASCPARWRRATSTRE